MAGQQICLKWNSFQSNIVTSFENLWEEEGLVDVTLASDGQCLRAHKVILSACSPFFRKVFQANPCQHPVIILQDVHFTELESLLYFVYKGEVNIEQENLPALLRAAETLQIRGLSGASEQVKEKMGVCKKSTATNGTTAIPSPVPVVTQEATTAEGPTPSKRPRSIQQSQSPPLPSTPLALTPTSRPSHLRNSSTTSAEPWEQPQQPGEPEFPPKIVPKVEVKDTESDTPSSPLLSVEENFEDSTDGSLPDFTHSQGKSTSMDTGQIKGISKSETTTLPADANVYPPPEASKLEASTGQGDSNYDPNQATKNFPYPPFPCPFCDRAYTSWGFRRRHIKAMHTQSQKLPCKWCLLTLPSHGDWEKHVMTKHSLSPGDAHNGLLILEEAHMVLQIPNPTRLDTFVNMIKNKKNDNGKETSSKKANGSAGENHKSGV